MYQLHNASVLNQEHLPIFLRETTRLIADERQFSSVYAKGLADIYIGAQDFDSQEDFLRGVLAETRILAKDVRWKIARTYRVFLQKELPFLARGEYIRELLGMAVGILNEIPEPDAETLEEIASCERSIGRSYEFTGDYKAACGAYWRSVLIYIKLHAAASKETGKHFPAAKDLRRLSAVFQYFALMLETTGETERAEIYYLSMLACERDLEIVEQLSPSKNPLRKMKKKML